MSNLFDSTQELIRQIEPRKQAGGVNLIGLDTGYKDMNYALGGWRNDEMYSVAGKTGSGKSSFCLSAGIEVAKQSGSVFYLSLEMSTKLLALRTLSALTGIPAMKIEKGQLTDESWKEVQAQAQTFKGLSIYFYDRSMDTRRLPQVLAETRNDFGLDLAIVDYIALLQDQGTSAYERVTNISINLRGMARDFDIPLIVVSQLNRASLNREGGRPEVQDLKETGQIENDSGAVIFPFRPHSGEELGPDGIEEAEIIIAKNRHGPTGTYPVEFLPRQMIWRDKKGEVEAPPKNARRK